MGPKRRNHLHEIHIGSSTSSKTITLPQGVVCEQEAHEGKWGLPAAVVSGHSPTISQCSRWTDVAGRWKKKRESALGLDGRENNGVPCPAGPNKPSVWGPAVKISIRFTRLRGKQRLANKKKLHKFEGYKLRTAMKQKIWTLQLYVSYSGVLLASTTTNVEKLKLGINSFKFKYENMKEWKYSICITGSIPGISWVDFCLISRRTAPTQCQQHSAKWASALTQVMLSSYALIC